MSRTVILFPPFAESALHGPHLAAPLLVSVLRENGFDCVSEDLNIKTIRRLLNPASLDIVLQQLDTVTEGAEREKYQACIRHLKDKGVRAFANAGTSSLRVAFAIFRKALFPTPETISECLDKTFLQTRPQYGLSIYDEFIQEIAGLDVQTIGMSVAFSEQLSEAIIISRLIRERFDHSVRLILGGGQVNLLSASQIAELAKAKLFNAISIGNGEQTISKLITVPMDAYNDGCHIVRSPSMSRQELEAIPSPAFADTTQYFAPLALPVLVTKGCYWGKCTFCDYPRLSNLGGLRFIPVTPQKAFTEIKHHREKYPDCHVNLISDAVPASWYRKLCALALQEDVQLNSWSYMMHEAGLEDGFFSLLSQAGVKAINFGTESTNDRILSVMCKQSDRKTVLDNLSVAARHNIAVVVNLIPDYPTSTFTDALILADDIRDRINCIESLNPHMFDLTEGSVASQTPERFNLNVENNAYQRSNHGFHTMRYQERNGLTTTQRNIVRRIFIDLKRKTAITRRLNGIQNGPVTKDTYVEVDGSALLVGRKNKRLWIVSLDTEIPLSPHRAKELQGFMDACSSPMGLSDMQRAFKHNAPQNDGGEDPWYALLSTGLIIHARHQHP